MEGASLAYDLALALIAALIGGSIAARLKIPVVVGFMLAGIVVGPFTPGPTGNTEHIQLLAEIGVVLLMFGVGVDFSIEQLRSVRQVATLGGVGQVVATILLGIGIGMLLGWPWGWQVFFGCILAISSTTVLLKVWMERGELGSQHGQITLGISLVQDLTTVVMIVLLPALTTTSAGTNPLLAIGWSLLQAGAFFGLMLLLGTRLFPWLLKRIAQRSSRELFLLATVALSVGTAFVATELFGLSLALGAFMAGLVVSESELHYRILGEVLPLRDIFSVLFFVSVGMLIDPLFIVEHLMVVVLVSLTIVLGKFAITALAIWPFGYTRRATLLAAAGLAQIGEFSFILAQQGLQLGVLDNFVYSLTLSGALLSALATPFLLRCIGPITDWFDRIAPPAARPAADLPEVPRSLRNHIVLCGYGRLGSHLAEALRELHHPHVVVEQDWLRVKQARQQGTPVIFGDATMPAVLGGASLEKARAVVVALPDPANQRLTVQQVRSICPHVPIIARAYAKEDLPSLYGDGATEVILPSFEGSLEMLRQTLLRLGVTVEAIQSYTDAIHSARYEPWRNAGVDGRLLACLRRASQGLTIEWYQVPADSIHVGLTISALNIRQHTGASVVALVRGSQVLVNPQAGIVLDADDRLAVLGNEQQRQQFVSWLMNSKLGMTVPMRLIEPELPIIETDGADCFAGTAGTAGADGTDGAAGASGTDGTDGTSGTDGTEQLLRALLANGLGGLAHHRDVI